MTIQDTTDWREIRAAAIGDAGARETFARRYQDFVRDRLQRTPGRSLAPEEVDDAAQEVFVECFKQGGVLAAADPDSLAGFRAFLTGVIDNVARRVHERAAIRRKHLTGAPFDSEQPGVPSCHVTPSQQMDRDWAIELLQAAAAGMRERAERLGPQAKRRVELLERRFHDNQPIRAIAAIWQVDAAVLHHQYAKAREEFRQALLQTMASRRPLAAHELEAECERLLQLLAP